MSFVESVYDALSCPWLHAVSIHTFSLRKRDFWHFFPATFLFPLTHCVFLPTWMKVAIMEAFVASAVLKQFWTPSSGRKAPFQFRIKWSFPFLRYDLCALNSAEIFHTGWKQTERPRESGRIEDKEGRGGHAHMHSRTKNTYFHFQLVLLEINNLSDSDVSRIT